MSKPALFDITDIANNQYSILIQPGRNRYQIHGSFGLPQQCSANEVTGKTGKGLMLYRANGWRRIMVSLRSGPVEIISTGAPAISSVRLI